MTDIPPGILAEIVDIVGYALTERLAVRLGGQSVHVPRAENLTDSHALTQAIGVEAAQDIAHHFAGDALYVPRARRWVARQMIARDASTSEIARALMVSHSAARSYRKRN